MPKFSEFSDLSNLFVALSGILFASWYSDFEKVLAGSKPPLYRNRKKYITDLQSAIVGKASPLVGFLFAYAISLSGVMIETMKHGAFTLWLAAIDPTATLFCLTYLLSLYLLSFSSVQLLRLVTAWWGAGCDRALSEPRITTFR